MGWALHTVEPTLCDRGVEIKLITLMKYTTLTQLVNSKALPFPSLFFFGRYLPRAS